MNWTRELKDAAAVVRKYWRESPKDRLVKTGLSPAGATLLSLVESIPSTVVIVDRAQLERWKQSIHHSLTYLHSHGVLRPECNGNRFDDHNLANANLDEIDKLLTRGR